MTTALPAIRPTRLNAFFWEGARDGRLLIQRCGDCGHFQHPPLPACSACLSDAVAPEAVSGRGVVDSFTIIRRAFHPAFAERLPYCVARIALVEQDHLYLVTNIVECAVDAIAVGMPVVVRFEHREEGSLPQFAPEIAS